MGYQTTCVTGTPAWRKLLASATVFLAAVLFLAHSVIAGGMPSHSQGQHDHGHSADQAEQLTVLIDAAAPHGAAKAAASTAHDCHRGDGAPPCCGDACHLALIPQNSPALQRLWHVGSILLVPASLLSGLALEGLRRPPRLPV